MNLPNDSVTVLAIDTESHTPQLKELGPMCIQGKDFAIGISVASADGFAAYYPLRHTEGNGPVDILVWLRWWLAQPDNLAIFAHAKFDIEMLWSLGLDIKCRCYDVLAVDALINENHALYSLDAISKRYGLGGKEDGGLTTYMLEHDLYKPHRKNQPDMGKMREVPPEVVAPYAIQDAKLTWGCYARQTQLIPLYDLGRVVQLENDLIPVLWDMRLEGVPVDIDRAEQINTEMLAQGQAYLKEIRLSHPGFEPFASAALEKFINSYDRYPPRTNTGKPSVTNEWLEGSDIQELRDVAHYRRYEKIRRDFIDAVILKTSHKGKIHPSWSSTRGSGFRDDADEGDIDGTRTGRIACTRPNLAQIPRRHKVLGPQLRSMFVPRDGEVWHKADYASQEPRITLHYAVKYKLPGAEDIANRYYLDKQVDYHQIVTDLVNAAGPARRIDRDIGKTINLALVYGLGRDKLANQLQLGRAEVDDLLDTYHRAVPFVKPLQDYTKAYADKCGFINTELGRRRHFDLWEKSGYGKRSKALPEEEAKKLYKFIQRAMTYKALNAAVQGTAAEQCKTAMRMLHAERLTPLITLYDELGHSIPPDPQISKRICDIMETALPQLLIPHFVEPLMGKSWDLKKPKPAIDNPTTNN